MKLHNANAAVEVSGGEETSIFSIACNGKAFKVLSDTLYQDKIGSIVRELSCNAYDAHIMQGNQDKPFEIHLPDAFEPWFAVKDFGIGLSAEDVRSVFTVYFQSTKDQSNDAIGSFGLGAKTPFSYTDQFTVTSVKDGIRTIYSAYLTETGVPNITTMFSEETTESSGVEIKVSVKREDYHKFKDAVCNQLKYFKVKPIISNGAVHWSNNTTPIYEDANCCIQGNGYPIIIQGQVGYPLNLDTLNGKISTDVHAFLKRVNSYGVILHFNIGEIGVTASREGVEYTVFTCKNIENKLKIVEKSLMEHYRKQLDDCSNSWEKAVKINSDSILKLMLNSYTVQGATLTYYSDRTFSLQSISTGTFHNVNKRNTNPKVDKLAEKQVTPSKFPTVIFVRDKTSQINLKIKELCKKYEVLYEYVPNSTSTNPKKEIADALGGFDNVVLMSEYNLPKEIKEANRSRSAIAKYWECVDFNTNPNNWTKHFDSIEDIKDDFYYVVLERLDYADMKDTKLMNRLTYLKAYESAMIIGIRSSAIDKVLSMSNAKPLEFLVTKLESIYRASKYPAISRKYQVVDTLKNLSNYKMRNFISGIKSNVKNHRYIKTLKSISEKKDTLTLDCEKAYRVCTFLNDQHKDMTRMKQKFQQLQDGFYKDFPLLKAYGTYDFSSKISDAEVEDYMNLVYNTKT